MEFWGKHWRAVIGVLLLFGPLARGIRWLFEVLGNIALIADHLAVVALMFEYLTDPPAWTTLPFILGGLALIYLDRRQPVTAAPLLRGAAPKPLQFRTPAPLTEADRFWTLYKLSLLPAANGAYELLSWLAKGAKSFREDATIFHYHELLQRGVIEPEREALRHLEATIMLDPMASRLALNKALVDYYRAYLSARTWIATVPSITGAQLQGDRRFASWGKADQEFLGELRRFSGGRDALFRELDSLGWGDETTVMLKTAGP